MLIPISEDFSTKKRENRFFFVRDRTEWIKIFIFYGIQSAHNAVIEVYLTNGDELLTKLKLWH